MHTASWDLVKIENLSKQPEYVQMLILHITSRAGMNLRSISTAATCLAPACNTERVKDPGPEPTSHTKQSNTSASLAILSARKDLEFFVGMNPN